MQPAVRSTSWVWFGLAAMLIGYLATWLVVFLIDENDAKVGGEVLINAIESEPNQLLFRLSSGAGLVAASLLFVYGAGVRRALSDRTAEGSLLPAITYGSFVAAAGLLAIGFIIRGIVFDSTGWYGEDPRIAFYVMGMDIPLAAWSLLGVAAAACAYAAFRLNVLPTWFGIVSIIAVVLVAATWMTGTLPPGNFPAGIWLIASVFAFGSLEREPVATPLQTAVPASA